MRRHHAACGANGAFRGARPLAVVGKTNHVITDANARRPVLLTIGMLVSGAVGAICPGFLLFAPLDIGT
jgi:hypothetical protein